MNCLCYNSIYITLKYNFSLKKTWGTSHCGSVVMNPTSIHEDAGTIPGLFQWGKDLVGVPETCGVGRRCGSDLGLGLWCRSAATALMRPPAWKLPYAMGTDLRRQKQKQKQKQKQNNNKNLLERKVPISQQFKLR